MGTDRTERIAALVQEIDRRSPAGFAIALHIQFWAPTFLFQSYPTRWTEYYSAEGLVLHDPTVRWGMNNVGRMRWAELEWLDERGVFERARDHGIMNGFMIATAATGSRSIASFARADRDFDEREADELEAMLAELHRLTAGPEGLTAADRSALTELSIRLTRP